MEHADKYLKTAVVGLSIALVLILAVVAVFSVFGGTTSTTADPAPTTDIQPAGTARPYPGDRIEIDDAEFPLSIGCLPGRQGEGAHYVVIKNYGTTVADYVVAAELTGGGGEVAEAMAEVTGLAPGEEREIVLVPREDVGSVASCEITAIQGDRRVLLTNR